MDIQMKRGLLDACVLASIRGAPSYGYQIINDGQDIEFFVKDTGSGIEKKDISHIFETYMSRDAETSKNSYGLGLPLCKIIVERLGGKISVESEEGKGSMFRFTFPFDGSIGGYDQNKTTTTSNVRTIRINERADQPNMKTILVAEDEDSNYELVKIVLQKRHSRGPEA